MSTKEFSILSAILIFEILMGYGLVFALDAREKIDIPAIQVSSGEQEPLEQGQVPIPLPAPQPSPEATAGEAESLPSPPQSQIGQLANPPEIIKAVYLTGWSAGAKRMIDYVIDLAKTTEMNAVVIDAKDFSGEVAYETNVPEVVQYGAQRVKIWDIDALLKRLHQEGIYVIARITVFQDPVLAKARPDLAVQSIAQEGLWADFKGLGWIDPASQEAWKYNAAIARDAAHKGFDEINFDYVRFPSDGDLKDMKFPFWDGQTSRQQIIRDFFAYLREDLGDTRISADVFGLTTMNRDDLGIGQVIEDAYEYFDYVYPMVYPSHYAYGFLGYQNPAEYPYEVVSYSMANALARLRSLRQLYPDREFAKLRPWLQDFDLGAKYDTQMVQAQVRATQEVMGEEFRGFLLWSPTNYYTAGALNPFVFDKATYDARLRTQP